MNYLTFKIKAPMGSFGERTTALVRTTSSAPTKSAIIGMISAALGYKRGDERILDLFALKFSWKRQGYFSVTEDYQNTAYMTNKSIKHYESNLILGKVRRRGDLEREQAFQTKRHYLETPEFEIFLSGPLEELKEIKAALENPKFTLYMGRKSCLLSRPLIPVLGDNLDEVLFQASQEGQTFVGWEHDTETPQNSGQVSRPDTLNHANQRTFATRTEYQMEIS